MFNKVDFETKLGGLFGLIAATAIIIEVAIAGFDGGAIAGGIKDIAGTIVAILVLVVAVRKIRPRISDETFESVLLNGLDSFEETSQPLIHKAKDYDDEIRYYLITRMDRVLYASAEDIAELKDKGSINSGVLNGKFFDLSYTDNISLKFYLNASTFKDRAKVQNKSNDEVLMELCPSISNCISSHFSDMCIASPSKDGKAISIDFSDDFSVKMEERTTDMAREIVDLIKYVMTLYTIAA